MPQTRQSARRRDIELPDEQKGKPIGTMNRGGIGHTVMGGDPDDPRWAALEARRRDPAPRAPLGTVSTAKGDEKHRNDRFVAGALNDLRITRREQKDRDARRERLRMMGAPPGEKPKPAKRKRRTQGPTYGTLGAMIRKEY